MSKYVLKTKKVLRREQVVIKEHEADIPIYDWDAIPDQIYAEATLRGINMTGAVVKENDNLYFLHNNPEFGGSAPKQMFGYKYSWCFTINELEAGESDIMVSFPEPPSDFVLTPDIVAETIRVAGYDGFVYTNGIQLGCQFVTKEIVAEVLKMINESKVTKDVA